MTNCLFCKIAKKVIPSDIVYEDDHVLAFSDINPQAPQHKLIIPKKHIASLNELTSEDTLLVGQVIQTAKQLATQLGMSEGYRLVSNCGSLAGQSVFHLHFHLLGGRALHWPPG
ncbi:MAG: histidine triad nucleotide-binding protein [Gammaproteobacteria bacterium]|nr:histidine triad nucleotide-binding protein [Gammaproteobacteria bacterium]